MVVVALTAAALPAFAEEAWEKTAQTLYEHGWFLQTSEKNFAGAADVFKKLTERFGDDKAYCALARVRIGECADALGKKDEAVAMWQKVLADFPDQAKAVRDARLLLAGFDPRAVGSLEDLKKQINGLKEKSMLLQADRQLPLVLAAAYPAEGAEFLHAKLVEEGKAYGPVLAAGETDASKITQALQTISTCLQALASCDTEKTAGFLLDLLSRADKAEGQFLGGDTALAITASFAYLQPQRVNDAMVDLATKQISETEKNPRPRTAFYRLPAESTSYPIENPGPAYGFYVLAALAGSNAKALDYLKAEAVSAGNERHAGMAMAALTRMRKPQTAEFYEKIATGKYPEEFRHLAIACLGWLGKTRYYYPAPQPPFGQLEDSDFLRLIAYGLQSPQGRPWPMTYATQYSKTVYADKDLLDACVKSLKAAFDFNNSVGMRNEVITALSLLKSDAAIPPLVEYAKNAVDPAVRETAVLVLGDILEYGGKNEEAAAAFKGLMKDDPVRRVRLQAAWSFSRMGNPPNRQFNALIIPRETIGVVLENLVSYKGLPPTTSGYLATNITVGYALDSLLSTTLHGNLQSRGPSGYAYDETTGKAIDELANWWEANKDKTEAEWAAMAMDEWVKKNKEMPAAPEAVAAPQPRAAIEPAIDKLINAYVGKPQPAPRPARPATYVRYSSEQIKMICDWWDKNHDKVKWDAKERCFKLPGPNE